MFKTTNNNIVMSKGDSVNFNIKLVNGDGTEFVPDKSDKIIFSVKRQKGSLFPVIFSKEGCQISLDKEDTEKIESGKYVYDVIVVTQAGERQTVIEGFFEIRDVVHELK